MREGVSPFSGSKAGYAKVTSARRKIDQTPGVFLEASIGGMLQGMDKSRKTPWGLWVAAGLLLLLVAYPLSIGPMSFVIDIVALNAPIPECVYAIYDDVYAPLLAVQRNGPDWLSQPLSDYLMWWGELAESI